MAVEIRKATEADLPRLLELGAAMHAESPRYRRFRYSPEKVAMRLLHSIEQGGALVAVLNGTIVGGFAGFVTEMWFSDEKIAADYAIFLEPEHRRSRAALLLVRAFEEWAAAQGVVEIVPGVTTEINAEATVRFYEKLGYEAFGVLLHKKVPNVR